MLLCILDVLKISHYTEIDITDFSIRQVLAKDYNELRLIYFE